MRTGRGAAVAGVVTLAVVAAGCSSSQQIGSSGHPNPPAALHIVTAKHHAHRVAFDKPLRVHVRHGALTAVTVREADGTIVPGAFNPRHTAWRSRTTFIPLTKMVATVNYLDLDHKSATRQVPLRATDAKTHLSALLSPGAGDTVGVGSPVAVSFSRPVPDAMRAAVERRLSVQTAPKVVGAWHWMSDQSVHWRPPAYWKTGTHVTISSDLQGLNFGDGVWGANGHHSTSFKVGDAHVSEVDVGQHVMRVYNNGTLIKTFPVSAGRDQYPTMGGVHIAIDKAPKVIMDSATVGIPKGNPDYYYETVYWDVRITDGGAFVHAAPWSVSDQGNTNVSHGCVNLSTTNAEWFYNWSLRGDIIDVYDTPRPPSPTDPGTADWNMSWKQWVAGDALPTAAAKRLHPPMPRDGEPGFGPAPKHQHHTHHHVTHA
ncbi:MAG TPA: Ig-like domain-containing protein [Mycobacteriales bacterium]|nr:Ig-like domain-containing protein [Mycobacteriales bacterium]